MDSKSHKLLQQLNLNLDKAAAESDDERAILAKSLHDYSGGMLLELALHEVCAELEALESQDIAMHQQVTQEMEKLGKLEEKVRKYQTVVSHRLTYQTQIAHISGGKGSQRPEQHGNDVSMNLW